MKPKIPKLTKKERRMWIKALKELLDWYKDKTKEMNRCSLCKTSQRKGLGCSIDHYCPWYWFTNGSCEKFVYDKMFINPVYYLRKNRYFSWVKLRLRQIPQWIKKLEEDL